MQFRIASSGAWDPSNDWSFTGVGTTPGGTPVLVQRIPVYDNGVRVFGNEPGGSTPDTAAAERAREPARDRDDQQQRVAGVERVDR